MAREVQMADGGDDPKATPEGGAGDGRDAKGEGQTSAPQTPQQVLAGGRRAGCSRTGGIRVEGACAACAQRPLVERAVVTREVRVMARAVRAMLAFRRRLTGGVVRAFVRANVHSEADAHSTLLALLAQVRAARGVLRGLVDTDEDMEGGVDAPSPAPPASAEGASTSVAAAGAGAGVVRATWLAEVEMFSFLTALVLLIDRKAFSLACECAWAAVRRLQQLNRRTLDVLGARIYFYFSLAHERTTALASIRSTLLAAFQTATLRHDEIGQEMLLNLLLRNYLAYNLYDQADKLRSKALRPDSHSNQQLCRQLYYAGRIAAVQLEYSAAKDCLQQAARKAPAAALGFRTECTRWHVLVRLLLGEIPERHLFVAPGMRSALLPFFQLTNAVRVGDLQLFHAAATQHAAVFAAGHMQKLIVRLRHNVIRTALRRISLAYSRISLADIALKLHLPPPTAVADAECIVAKAIRDGGIEAVIERRQGCMVSKEGGDVYTTLDPQAAFHTRIAYCLNLHNEAVKAMQFPPSTRKGEADAEEKRRERQLAEQELAQHIAEEGDDDF
ncbi:unnamed protein product [Closterium sp. Naga37s-1]|nr:unnamed protein product [Closterium sp. Naga37s-1]